MKALVYGEMIWDVYPDAEVIGGAAFNFAAHLAHMGAETHFISAVGADELGTRALSVAKRHGIETDLIQTTCRPTGACLVTLREGGLPSFNVLQNVAYDVMEETPELLETVRKMKPDFFYFNTLCQRGQKSRETLKNILKFCDFQDIVCDINLRVDCYDEDSLRRCMENATIIKISDEEGSALYDLGLVPRPESGTGEAAPDVFCRAVAKAFPKLRLVVYTLGKNGSAVLDTRTGVLYESGLPRKTKVVSTVGAGDSYGAAFCFAFFGGKTIRESIAYAAEMSARVVENQDAVPLSMYE